MPLSPQQQQHFSAKVDTHMPKAAEALAQARWVDAARHYRKGGFALAMLKGHFPDVETVWQYFQCQVGQAYALHQLGNPAHQRRIADCLLEACIYHQSEAHIREQLAVHEHWHQHYQALRVALNIPEDVMLLPTFRLLELDKQKDFAQLMQALTRQCQHDNKGQTPLYLAIEYHLERLCLHLLRDASYVIDLSYQDADGQTLGDYATRYEREAVVNGLMAMAEAQEKMIQHRQQRQQRLAMREARWQETPLPLSPVNKAEDTWLRDSLCELLEPHSYDAAYLAVTKARRRASKNLRQRMEGLYNQLLSPEQHVVPKASRRFFPRMFNKSNDTADSGIDTRQLRALIEKIKAFHAYLAEEPQEHAQLMSALMQMLACYEDFIAAPSLASRAIFYSQDEGPAYVQQRFLGCFFPEQDVHGDTQAAAEKGMHAVHEARGMHFKLSSEFPGVEYMTYALDDQIAGGNCPPTRLVKVFYKQFTYLYMISKTMEGEALNSICDERPAYLTQIEPANFSDMFFLSLMTDPKDGKGENYQFRPNYMPITRALHRAKIAAIDNDLNFAIPVITNAKGHALDIKCIIYLLPGMNDPIDSGVKERLRKLEPASFVLKWLQSLQRQNNHYLKLKEGAVLSATDFERYQLPIRVRPGTAQTLYDKLTRIQALLSADTDNTLTHKKVLKVLQPLVYRVYKKLLAREGHPNRVIEQLYAAAQHDAWSLEELLHDELDTELTPGETIRAYLNRQHATRSDFEVGRSESIETTIHDFIAELPLKELSSGHEEALILLLTGQSSAPIEHITLRASRLSKQNLQDYVLRPLGSEGRFKKKPLQTLRLIDCDTTAQDIALTGSLYGVTVTQPGSMPFASNPASPQIDMRNSPQPAREAAEMFPLILSPSNGFDASPSSLVSFIRAGSSSRALADDLFPQYSDEEIQGYLDVAITQAPFGGRGEYTYRVYGANAQETLKDHDGNDYHLFLLPALDDLPSTHRALSYPIDSASRLTEELASVAEQACASDSLDGFLALLAQGQEEGKQYDTLYDLHAQYPTWDALKPALEAFIQQERKPDVVDELLASIPSADPSSDAPEDAALPAVDIRAKILFAYNQGQRHWLVGELVVVKQGKLFTIAAYAHDPYGRGRMQSHVALTLRDAFAAKLQRIDATYQVTLTTPESPYGRRQGRGDSVSCGPIVAEDMIKRLQGLTLNMPAPYAYGANVLRIKHAEKTGRSMGEQTISSSSSAPLSPPPHVDVPLSLSPDPDVDTPEDAVSSSIDGAGLFAHVTSKPIDIKKRREIPPSSMPTVTSSLPSAYEAELLSRQAPSSPPSHIVRSPSFEHIELPVPSDADDARDVHGSPEKLLPSWRLSVDTRRDLTSRGENVQYIVVKHGYAMVLDAIKSSSDKKHYLPFIALLIEPLYKYNKDAEPAEELERRRAIYQHVHQLIVKRNHDQPLKGIPLHCRPYFSGDDYMEEFYALAGSVESTSREAEFNNNLALLAVLFSVPFITPEQQGLPRDCQHTLVVAHFFKDYYPHLWREENKLGYSAEKLYALLHGRMPPQQLIEGIANHELKLFYRRVISLWRVLHRYLTDWALRKGGLEELDTRLAGLERDNSLFNMVATLFYMAKKKLVLEEDVFLSRKPTALAALAIVDVMVFLPAPGYLKRLQDLRRSLGRRFLNGSSLSKFMDLILDNIAGTQTHALISSARLLQSIQYQQAGYDAKEKQRADEAEERRRKSEEESKRREWKEKEESRKRDEAAQAKVQAAEAKAQAEALARAEAEAQAQADAHARAEAEAQAQAAQARSQEAEAQAQEDARARAEAEAQAQAAQAQAQAAQAQAQAEALARAEAEAQAQAAQAAQVQAQAEAERVRAEAERLNAEQAAEIARLRALLQANQQGAEPQPQEEGPQAQTTLPQPQEGMRADAAGDATPPVHWSTNTVGTPTLFRGDSSHAVDVVDTSAPNPETTVGPLPDEAEFAASGPSSPLSLHLGRE